MAVQVQEIIYYVQTEPLAKQRERYGGDQHLTVLSSPTCHGSKVVNDGLRA